jgi:Ubiquitin fusion degradation protein UFD1
MHSPIYKLSLHLLAVLPLLQFSLCSAEKAPFWGDAINTKTLQRRMATAKSLATLEQSVDDANAQWIAAARSAGEAVSYRRLIAMPLTEAFDPPMGVWSHKHVQTGDKMSIPRALWSAIQQNDAQVPWLFEVRRVDGVTGQRVETITPAEEKEEYVALKTDETSSKKKKEKVPQISDWGAARPLEPLDAVVGGILDTRAPPNYIFLPWWMMRALGLKARDVVDVRLITDVPPGSFVKFRPLTEQTIKDMANPQAVLETELRHYSSFTKGSTIAFDYNKKRYWFEVVECRSAPRGEKKPMIKAQDCDVATEFLPAKDVVEARKKKKAAASEDKK